jgi:hypothetical protein
VRCLFYFGLGALGIKRMVEMAPLAQSAAESALAIDPTLSEAHSVLGTLAGRWSRSRRSFASATPSIS